MVSVFLPAYNNEKHLSKSLQSILNQTYNNIEVVICDDGSTDNTYQIAKNYKKKYLPPEKFVNLLGKKFSPYCSVATWYLWRSIDPEPIQY